MQKNIISGLTNNQLKIIAMASMLIDHVGYMFFPHHEIFRIIGRIAFPIFAYMIAEGCFYTKNRRKHLLLILLLGIGCQAVSTIATESLYQNILLTFSLSIATIFSIDMLLKKRNFKNILAVVLVVSAVVFLTLVAPAIWKNKGFEMDYGIWGVLLPVFVYFSPKKSIKIFFTILILAVRIFLVNTFQAYALLAVVFLILYNGERGKLKMKYVFYIFYPAHLALIYLIDMVI